MAEVNFLVKKGLTVPKGSASTPAIIFDASDPNTGIYSPAADQLAISTNGTGRLFVDSSGRVGVGAAPSQALDVTGNGRFFISGGSPSISANNGTIDHYIGVNATGGLVGTSNNYPVLFLTNNTERMRLDSSGRLGLGDSAPANKLQVLEALAAIPSLGSGGHAVAVAGSTNYGLALGGLTSGEGYLQAGRWSGAATAYNLLLQPKGGSVGIGATTVQSRLHVAKSGAEGYEFYPGDSSNANVTLHYNRSGSAWVSNTQSASAHIFSIQGTEAARVDSSSRLLVGTSSSIDSNSLIQAYKASGAVRCLVDSDSVGNGESSIFSARGGARETAIGVFKHSGITNPCSYFSQQAENSYTSYYWTDNSDVFRTSTDFNHIGTTSGTVVGTQTSDERLKNILGPLTYGLDEIKQLNTVRYALKSDPEQVPHLGFIAQQVNPIIPESVFDTNEVIEEGEPTKLGMEYVALIPVLVNAIKELSAEVDALKAQLQAS